MACNPTRLELSNTDATSVQVTISPDPGDGTVIAFEVSGLNIASNAGTVSGVASYLIGALTQDTNSLWDGTLQVGSNAPADVVVQIVETSAAQVVGVTVSDAGVSYCAPAGGGEAQNLGDLGDVNVAGAQDGEVLGYDGTEWVSVGLDETGGNPEYVYGDASILSALESQDSNVMLVGDSISREDANTFYTWAWGFRVHARPDQWNRCRLAATPSTVDSLGGGMNFFNVASNDGSTPAPGHQSDILPNDEGGDPWAADLVGYVPTKWGVQGIKPNFSGNGPSLLTMVPEDLYNGAGASATQVGGLGYTQFVNKDGTNALEGDVVAGAYVVGQKGGGADTTTGYNYIEDLNLRVINQSGTNRTAIASTTISGSGLGWTVLESAAWDLTLDTSAETYYRVVDASDPAVQLVASASGYIRPDGVSSGLSVVGSGWGGWQFANHTLEPGDPAIPSVGGGVQQPTYLASYTDEGFQAWASITESDTFFIHLGTNPGSDWDDAGAEDDFFADLKALVTRIRNNCETAEIANPKFIIMGLYVMDQGDAGANARYTRKTAFNALVAEWAPDQSDVVFLDLQSWIETEVASGWGDLTSANPLIVAGWVGNAATGDVTHPTAVGMSNMFRDFFWVSVKSSSAAAPVVRSPPVYLETLADVSAGTITSVVTLNQAQYDDIGTPDPKTLYVIE